MRIRRYRLRLKLISTKYPGTSHKSRKSALGIPAMEAYFAEDDAANEGIEALLGFQDLNHVFALQGVGPHDRQLQQAMAFMLNSGGGVKQSNSPPGSPSRSHTGSPLSSLLHKIEDLQRLLLQLVAQADVNNKTATTGIEKLVDQLMVVAKGMLLQQQQQQAVLLPNTSAAAAFNEHYCSSSSSNLFVEDFSVDFAGGLRDFAATEETLVAEQFQPEKQYISYLASLADEVQDPVLLVAGPTTAAAAKEEEEEAEGDSLPPGSYDLIELDAMEILAEHTHFCEICGKGFKRDANLRMHMRGHGDEYKTAAALARPDKAAQDSHQQQQQQETTKRYSCPLVGCKRNKLHGKFVPLKTVLCVKNHYRRTHCPKMLTCSKCHAKRFSVVADLRTHEKHCGREKWQCSCGTTFSRKDKLLGHLGLFVGHTPVMPGSSDLGRPAPRWGFDLGNPAPRFAPRLRYNNVNGVQQQHVNAGNSSTSEQGSVEEAVVSWSILASN